MLMLHGAKEVKRVDLASILTPEPTDTWRPISHSQVVETLTVKAADRGLRIRNERFAVLDGALHPAEGVKIAVPNARLFGTMDFEPIPGLDFPPNCLPSAGLRNSHDKTFSLSILSGARVLVCANGVLSAEHIISRKHTSGIDLNQCIDRALDEFLVSIGSFKASYDRLNNWKLNRLEARDMIVELAKAGAFASADILPIVEEFDAPRHAEFAEHTAWAVYNSATEIMKKQSPARQYEGFRALNTVLCPLPVIAPVAVAA